MRFRDAMDARKIADRREIVEDAHAVLDVRSFLVGTRLDPELP